MIPYGPYKLLLVEDNPGDADLAQERLSDVPDFKYELHRVSTLSEAIEALKLVRYDAIILDINLPDASGIETLRRLRKVGEVGAIVVLSGNTDEDFRRLTLREGAQDFLGKNEPAARLLVRSVLYALERHRVQEQYQQLQRLVSSNPDAVIVTDLNGVVRYVNDAALQLFGKKREDFVGELLGFSIPEGQSAEVDILRGDKHFVCEMRVVHFEWRGEPAILATIRDVTEKRKIETERDELLTRLRMQIDRMPLAYILTDADLHLIDWNPAAERFFGYTREDVLGMGPPFEKIFGEQARPVLITVLERARQGDMSAHLVIENLTKSGKSITCEWSNTPLMDGSGRFLGLLSLVQDVSERKHLEDALRQSQKMEAIGQLAGGVAHDFNNLLTIINGYSDLVLEGMAPNDPARELLLEIRLAGERSAALTRKLLVLSRKQIVSPQIVALNQLIGDTASLLRRLIGEDVKLETSLRSAQDNISIDPGQVEQILMNLAVNARDAMPTGGRLTIETDDVELDANYCRTHPTVNPGAFVRMTVADSGAGIPENIRAKIFEPFFTTKPAGKGTGLGLAMTHGIVSQAGGDIEVYSEVGIGTAFKIYFPHTEVSSDRREVGPTLKQAPVGNETILVVEDEVIVRAFERHVLSRCGYHVLEAGDGLEALRLAREYDGTIHLLLTDVVMPELGGRSLGDQFLSTRPDSRILYVSGYTDDAIVRHGILHERVQFLQKPFSSIALACKVRQVLDGEFSQPSE